MSKSFIEKEMRFNLEDFRDLHYPFTFVFDREAFDIYKQRLFPKWFLDTNLWDMYNLDVLISYSSFGSLSLSVDKYRKVFIRRIDYPILELELQIVFYNGMCIPPYLLRVLLPVELSPVLKHPLDLTRLM